MTMQKAKVSLARQRHPTARDNRFGNPLRKPTESALTGDQKARRFQQLARELP